MSAVQNLGTLLDSTNFPEKIALIDYKPSVKGRRMRTFTYSQLDISANKIASALKSKKNLNKGSRIAIIAENSAEFIFTYIGILRAGLQPVLVNYKLSKEKIAQILQHSDVKLIFCDFDKKPAELAEEIVFESEDFLNFLKLGLELDVSFSVVDVEATETAFLLYTSGSTDLGLKAVLVSHQNHFELVQRQDSKNFKKYLNWIQQDDFKQITASPMFHMAGLTNIETMLYRKATLVLMPRFEPEFFLQAIQEHKIKAIRAVPAMLAMLLADKNLVNKYDVSSIQLVILGSAPLSAKLVEKIKKVFINAQENIYNGYGLTEVGASLFGHYHPKGIAVPPMSVGYPREGYSYRIIDGVLQVKAPSQFSGYLNNEKANKAAFTKDGYYITNDLFYVDEMGFYYCVGRTDDMFISGGENIFPSEIEQVLEQNESVECAKVIGIDDEIKGKKPVAFVMLKHDKKFNETELKNYVAAHAPAYHIPKKIWPIEQLPLLASGKINIQELVVLAKKLIDERPVD